jgi:hypothetical protein
MLSTGHRYIFIHIPKTAGTSISTILSEWRPGGLDRAKQVLYYPKRVRPWLVGKHDKAVHIRARIGHDQYAKFFKFAVIRNPWDLMVSCYSWWTQSAVRWPVFESDTKYIAALGGFEGFIRSRYGACMINEFRGNMLDWICDDRGNVIVDQILRFENLDDDWKRTSRTLGMPYMQLPRENQGTREDYRHYYTEETRQLIAWRFRAEIELFGYEY